jgi:hypothetical protein
MNYTLNIKLKFFQFQIIKLKNLIKISLKYINLHFFNQKFKFFLTMMQAFIFSVYYLNL